MYVPICHNNLIAETTTDGKTKTYEYGGDNRLYKVVENGAETIYEYDLNGNLIKRGNDEFAYDADDKLVYSNVNGVVTAHEIGLDGLRKTKTTDNTTTTYDLDENGNVICENDDDIILGHKPLAKEIDGEYFYYIYNGHGDVVMMIDENGTIKNSYAYDPWGAIVSQSETIENSHKYAGEYYDDETGLIYLRARYYDPSTRRFIQEDPARDELNWYVYANNNPIKYVDPSGLRSKEAADKIIKDNASYIISAAQNFGVNPGILAATIYAEQRLNVDWKDDYIDGIVGFYGMDTSIGIGQVKISTAKLMEDEGYMPKISQTDAGWNVPIIGFVHGSEQMAREKVLEIPELNIKYAAGYLKYFQDEWEAVYPDIDGKTDILATLYNLGHKQTSPNSNPKPNDFGKFAKENYFHVRKLLGLE
ncbi:MAG: RHS repeat-associated core domain-containing protein [Ruminococcaceae bacterium]|nr:RHS repeat-associated core domain-containing protein [Oscillospiraceae bacterium]